MNNKRFPMALLLLSALSVSAQQRESSQRVLEQHRLMPVPASVKFVAGRLRIDASFLVALEGHTDPRLEAGLFRAARRLEGRMGVELSRAFGSDSRTATMLIHC